MRRQRSGLGVFGGPSAIGVSALGLTSQSDDIDAITQYITVDTPAKTDAARAKQDEYKTWIDTVSWYNKNYDRPTYDHARNLRNEFNEANATTPAEQQAVQQVETTGLTTEETQGAGRRVSSGGRFSEQTAPPPSLPTWAKWAIAGAIGLGALYALGKVTTLAEIFVGKRHSKPPPPPSNLVPNRKRRRRRSRR